MHSGAGQLDMFPVEVLVPKRVAVCQSVACKMNIGRERERERERERGRERERERGRERERRRRRVRPNTAAHGPPPARPLA